MLMIMANMHSNTVSNTNPLHVNYPFLWITRRRALFSRLVPREVSSNYFNLVSKLIDSKQRRNGPLSR